MAPTTSPCREAQEAAEGRAHALQHDLAGARAAAGERAQEVAQLREVSLQADQALQQCLAQLQVQPRILAAASVGISESSILTACNWLHPPGYSGSPGSEHGAPFQAEHAIKRQAWKGVREDTVCMVGGHGSFVQHSACCMPCLSQALLMLYVKRQTGMQALKADAEAKVGRLERAAEAQQGLQAEVDRLKQAYGRERDIAKTLQEDSVSWMSKAQAAEQVCMLHLCSAMQCSAQA